MSLALYILVLIRCMYSFVISICYGMVQYINVIFFFF